MTEFLIWSVAILGLLTIILIIDTISEVIITYCRKKKQAKHDAVTKVWRRK